jgi:predicted Zn-dependent protease
LGKVIPVGQLEEKELGESIKRTFRAHQQLDKKTQDYLTRLVQHLAKSVNSRYEYEAFYVGGRPNAMAIPGGVILVTEGLMGILHSEAELVSILGHEIGHVERGHCFDSVRFELLGKKLGSRSLGDLADMAYGIVTRVHFSKTQEAESDEFGFSLLTASGYDPEAMGRAFDNLGRSSRSQSNDDLNPFRDYLTSHPPVQLRSENFKERGRRFRERNGSPFYLGVENLASRTTRYENELPKEWK